jgi:hypothetical protein
MKKPLELPPDVAKRFVKDMRAFFAEEDATKRDVIAVKGLPWERSDHCNAARIYMAFSSAKPGF